MSPEYTPETWLGVIPYVIAGLPGVFAALGVFHGQLRAKERWDNHEQKADALLYEVQNDHRTNLRDDIDSIKDAVYEGFSETRKDLHGLREELRTERVERIEGDKARG